MDLLDLDRRALHATALRLDCLTSDDMTLPTPCAEWDVRALIEHLVGGNHLFAEAVSGTAVDWSRREGDRLGGDPAAAWTASADAVIRAFADADLDRQVDMRFGCVPVRQAILVHFVDVLTHGWDPAGPRGVGGGVDDQRATGARDALVFAMYHPAAALRTPAIERESYDDIAQVPTALIASRERRAARERTAVAVGAGVATAVAVAPEPPAEPESIEQPEPEAERSPAGAELVPTDQLTLF